MYHDKLSKFFRNKGLKQKEIAEILGYSPTMIGRYLTGTIWIGPEFILKLTQIYPEIDLNEIFGDNREVIDMVNEPKESYNYNVIDEIEDIEKRLSKLKQELARKSHGKKK